MRILSKKAVTKVQATIIVVIVAVIAVAGTSAYYMSIPAPKPVEPLRLGFLDPLTGTLSYIAPEMLHGGLSAVEEVNAAGGVLGRQVEVYIEDDQSDVTQSVLAAKKLVEINKVKGIIGIFWSAQALSIAPYVIENKILFWVDAGADDITFLKDDDFVYRTTYTASVYGYSLLKPAMEKYGIKRIGIHTQNQPYGLSEAKAIKKLCEENGIAYTEVICDMNKPSYRAEYEQLVAFNPDAIFHTESEADFIVAIRNAYELGFKGLHFLNMYNIGVDIAEKVGHEMAERFVVVSDLPLETDRYKELRQTFETRWGHKFGHTHGFSEYDAVMIMSLAAIKAGSTDTTAIRDAIRFVANSPGDVVKTFEDGAKKLAEGKDIDYEGCFINDINEYGDVVRMPFTIFEIHNGEWVKKGELEVPWMALPP